MAKDGKRNEAEALGTRIAIDNLYATDQNCNYAWASNCPAVRNSEPTPVIVRCEMYSSNPSERPPSLICQGYEKIAYKKTHYITPQTNTIEVNFYDLEQDPDPVPKPLTQQE